MHFRQFTKFCYQSKIIPHFASLDEINSTFRIIVSAYRSPGQRGDEQFSPYIDYEMFKKTLVRIALTGKGQDERVKEEELTAEITKQMRDEFSKEQLSSGRSADKDFEQWMAD